MKKKTHKSTPNTTKITKKTIYHRHLKIQK
jgi:hypothetical protein